MKNIITDVNEIQERFQDIATDKKESAAIQRLREKQAEKIRLKEELKAMSKEERAEKAKQKAQLRKNNASLTIERTNSIKVKSRREAKLAEKQAKIATLTQNGIRKPRDNSKAAKIWSLCDKLTADTGQMARVGHVLEVAKLRKYNVLTARTQYNKWKRYHGVFGKLPTGPQIDLGNYENEN